MLQIKKAFSLVEIVIVITIIALLAVIGLTANNNYQSSVNNAKVSADILTIDNAILAYEQANGQLPAPTGNVNYFKQDATYAHSGSAEIFGVHGFITEDTVAKQYLDILPLDPKTNQYYAYGKTKDSNEYEIAGINWIDESPVAFVKGNYSAEVGPFNLIREYNGPNFIENGSQTNFPYNPEERVLIAKIDDFSGSVSITTDSSTDIIDRTEILNYTLMAGDTVKVPL